MSHTTEIDTGKERSMFGFWVYLMTDCVLFASLFLTYAVMNQRTNGGPGASELFDLKFILTETIILLASSFVAGIALLAAKYKMRSLAIRMLVLTFLLGAIFLGMELYEFANLVAEGEAWHRNAFLSSYFTLVGTHGLHITAGLIWVSVIIVKLYRQGITKFNLHKLGMFSMFWHFLDVVWIFIFTFVYLMGAVK